MSDEHNAQTVTWTRLEGADPASIDFPVEATAGDQKILVFRTSQGFRGTEPLCPHLKAPLKTAVLLRGDTMVRCSRHHFIFRMDTGAGVNCVGMKLKVYDIRKVGEHLEVALSGF